MAKYQYESWQTFKRLVRLETDECIVWPFSCDGRGYGQVYLPGVRTPKHAHLLALEHHTPRPPEKVESAHGPCHNRACMNYRHLSWKTREQNQADRLRDGTSNRGERHGMSKLTAADVRAIRAMAGQRSQRAVARHFGTSRRNVQHIVNRSSWSWLP